MRTGKSWVFWLGLIILAMATVHVLTGTYYRPLNDVSFIVYTNTSRAVTGFAFFLAGLYIMYSGRNRPGSPVETTLF